MKNDLHEDHPPLIIKQMSENPEYLYPDEADEPKITINSGETISVFCPGRTDSLSSSILEPSWLEVQGEKYRISNSSVPIECIESNKFEADGKIIEFSEISCEKVPRAFYNPVLRETGIECGTGYRYEIGFVLNDESFLKTLDLCHDKKRANTLWAHDVIASINNRDVRYTGKMNKEFKTGILYENMTMSKESPYNLKNSYSNLISVFGSKDVADKYVSPKMGKSCF